VYLEFVLPHLPYSPDLAPSGFHLFYPLKDALRGRRFADDDAINTACVKSSDASAKNFTHTGYSVSRKGGRGVLVMKETLWKNNLNFVKYVPMIYRHSTAILIRISEKE
jgi:hypothetical protein